MADQHMLEQIGSGHIYFPEKELIHRHDMRHINARLEKDKGYVKTGPYTGDMAPEEVEISYYDMTKEQLVETAMEKHGFQVKLPMKNQEIIDILLELDEKVE